jgi:hypothetical protein
VLGVALSLCLPAWAQGVSETSLKAAFVYKFASYVEWPAESFPSPDSPFVIGVLGADDIAAELEGLVHGRSVGNRPAIVRRMKDGEPLTGLHMLFIGRRDAGKVPALSRAARALSVLVVSDAERGLEAGSVINLVVADERVGFEVSIEAAERSGLRLSSRMLGVARRVLARSP